MNIFIQIALGFGVASIACSQARLKVSSYIFCVISMLNAVIGLFQLTWGS